jgi:flagellar biosynthesis chaperone FliJ
MKPFKYKLSSVLKLREFEKQKIENQLSVLNNDIMNIKYKINTNEESISELQSNINLAGERRGLDVGLIQYFPEFLNATEKEIKNLSEELKDKERKRQEVLKHLDEALSRVKILENDKKKKQLSYKFQQQKKENLELEDMQIILRGRG